MMDTIYNANNAIVMNTVGSMLNIKHELSKRYSEYAIQYKGLTVKVINDTDENNGIYVLLDPYNSSSILSWEKIMSNNIDSLNDIDRLKELLSKSLNVLRENNLIFEIVDKVGITKEEYDNLYNRNKEE